MPKIITTVFEHGKAITTRLIRFAMQYPNTTAGLLIGFVLALLLALIPFIGPRIFPFSLPLFLLLGLLYGGHEDWKRN